VGQNIRIANARHHRAELEEEERRHHTVPLDSSGGSQAEDVENDNRITGLNFDEERKKRGRQQSDDPEEEEGKEDDAEEAVALGQAAAAKGFATADGAGKYFQDLPEDRLGDLSLTNPDDMKRLLGPSVRFAQHAMLLAEDRLKSGMPRDEVVRFLAEFYLGVSDRAYANKALRDFGAGTGIIDVYPLEVFDQLLEHVPSFFTKVSRGRFLTSSTTGAYKGKAGAPLVLTYDPKLRLRGFALKGGDRPGYLLEPVDPPGTYHLVFQTPGTFTVLVSAIGKDGTVAIEEFRAEIVGGEAAS
jgi:hypothetical protein